MKKNFNDLLGGTLPDDLVESVKDAFEQRIAESRAEIEEQVREDFARRYDDDRSKLINAMDAMLNDAIREHAEEKAAEVAKFTEARVKYHTAMVEGRKAIKARLSESMSVVNDIVTKQLSKEINSLHESKSAVAAKATKLAEDLKAAKMTIAEQHARHVEKIDAFVTSQVRKELVEFAEDKRALVESRVKLVSESRSKLKDTQSTFVKEAAKKVEAMVSEALKSNLSELHEDLERNRQNMFGRRIFEAVAAEFMTSYLAEGTEIRKLQKILESKNSELAEQRTLTDQVKAKLDEAANAQAVASRKVVLAEDRAERAKIMSELLSPLKGDKRSVMENLLDTTKTAELRKAFNKLLPVVLSEGRRKSTSEPAVLSETKKPTRVVSRPVSGDAERTNRLLEAAQEAEPQETAEIARMKLFAGIRD